MRVWVLVAGLLLACPIAAGAADVLINNGLDCSNPGNVIDHVTYQSDDVYVRNVGCGTPDPGSDCPLPGDATEVCIEVGGDVHGLNAYDSSTVAMSGGEVSYLVGAYDSSTVTINDGWVVNRLEAQGFSNVMLSGGRLENNLSASGSSNVTLDGGTVDGLLEAYGFSSVTMTAGEVETLVAQDSSTLAIRGGTVSFLLEAWGSSVITISGGTVASSLTAFSSSTVTLSGGTVEGWIHALHSSNITIMGTGFAVDGTPVPYDDLSAQTGVLTGRLVSGDSINNQFVHAGYPECTTFPCTGTITLAPPAIGVPALSLSGKLLLAAALLGIGVVYRRRPLTR